MCGRLLGSGSRLWRRLLALFVGLQLLAILLLYSRLVTLPASISAPADHDAVADVAAPAAAPGLLREQSARAADSGSDSDSERGAQSRLPEEPLELEHVLPPLLRLPRASPTARELLDGAYALPHMSPRCLAALARVYSSGVQPVFEQIERFAQLAPLVGRAAANVSARVSSPDGLVLLHPVSTAAVTVPDPGDVPPAPHLQRRLLPLPLRDSRFASFAGEGLHTAFYAAYHDQRKAQRYVRLVHLGHQDRASQTLYCHFLASSLLLPGAQAQAQGVDHVVQMERYELNENHGKTLRGYTMSCRVPDALGNAHLCFVHVSRDVAPLAVDRLLVDRGVRVPSAEQLSSKTLVALPVRSASADTYRVNPRKQFTVCVPALFGEPSPTRLAEFLETTLTLGADHFYLYFVPSLAGAVGSGAESALVQLLARYVRSRLASLVPWWLEGLGQNELWNYGQILAVNDCLLRAYTDGFWHAAFQDIDELIVPRLEPRRPPLALPHASSLAFEPPALNSPLATWFDVVAALRTENTCGYCFLSAFYDPQTKLNAIDGQSNAAILEFFAQHVNSSSSGSNQKLRQNPSGLALAPAPGVSLALLRRLEAPLVRHRSRSLDRIRRKCLVEVARVFEQGIHHVSKQLEEHWLPLHQTSLELDVPSTPGISRAALVHHYRQCNVNWGTVCKTERDDDFVEDAAAVRYVRAALPALLDELRELRLL